MMKLHRALFIATSLMLASCGGSSSGNNSTGDFRLVGLVVDGAGAPRPNLAVNAVSAASGTQILSSKTRSDGSLFIRLPIKDTQIELEIDGGRTDIISKTLDGPMTYSAYVITGVPGGPSADGGFEVQVDSASLCASFKTQQNELIEVDTVTSGQCLVSAKLISHSAPSSIFRARINGVCDGSETSFAAPVAESGGIFTLDLTPVKRSKCEEIYLEIYALGGTPNTARFLVYPFGRKT